MSGSTEQLNNTHSHSDRSTLSPPDSSSLSSTAQDTNTGFSLLRSIGMPSKTPLPSLPGNHEHLEVNNNRDETTPQISSYQVYNDTLSSTNSYSLPYEPNNKTGVTNSAEEQSVQGTNCSDSGSSKDGSQEDDESKSRKKRAADSNLKSDSGYWEKRRKNNESAKRSRDARRLKEEQIAMKVVYLEQENLQLKTEASLLKNEIEKLKCMIYNN